MFPQAASPLETVSRIFGSALAISSALAINWTLLHGAVRAAVANQTKLRIANARSHIARIKAADGRAWLGSYGCVSGNLTAPGPDRGKCIRIL